MISRKLLHKTILDQPGDQDSLDALEVLETVDDDLDRLGVGMIKVSEPAAAK